MALSTDFKWTDRIDQQEPKPQPPSGAPAVLNAVLNEGVPAPVLKAKGEGGDLKSLRARVIELEATVTRLSEAETSNKTALTTLLGIVALIPGAAEAFEDALSHLPGGSESRADVLELLSEIRETRRRLER
ncbi:MAG: hypothetical protein WCJ64_01255 [Rhodospirillaceae bacterium]